VPDNDWGEVVKAVLVMVPGKTITPEAVTEFAKSKLASFKAPQYVAIVDELPRNAMGKVLKNELRKTVGGAQNDL
jgi:acyl-CoA synthetase (AMP-forming)/AMP-acid ligase II